MSHISKLILSTPSYFSFEALQKSSEEIHSKELVERALLICQKEKSSVSIKREVLGKATEDLVISQDRILSIVQILRSKALSEEGIIAVSRLDDLREFLLELEDPNYKTSTLLKAFQDLDPTYQTILCRWVWHAYKEPLGDPKFGEHRIHDDPRILLRIADTEGNNCVERLIELLYQNSVISFQKQEIAQMLDPLKIQIPLDDKLKGCLHSDIQSLKAYLCYQVWWRNGGKENPEHSHIDPLLCGEKLADEDPSKLISVLEEILDLLERKEKNLEKMEAGTETFQIRDSDLIEALSLRQDTFYEQLAREYMKMRITRVLATVHNVENERLRIAIAKLCIEQDGGGVAENILKFRIKDEAARIKIAKLCAEKDAWRTAEYIQDFQISPKHQTILIEIAKLCAQRSGGGVAENIQRFGISSENQAALIEIATICAEKDVDRTAENIQKFEINPENQPALIGLATLCAQKEGNNIVENIEKFGIRDEGARIEIAKLCAAQSPGKTAKNIQKFEILDERSRIEVAKLCAQRSGWGTAMNIQKFEITNEEARIEIAKLCAAQSPGKTAQYIGNFAINPGNQIELIKIAKLCAKKSGKETAHSIQDFKINPENQTALTKIAQLCALSSGRDLFAHIDMCFFMLSEDIRTKIRNRCVVSAIFNNEHTVEQKEHLLHSIWPLCKEAVKNDQYKFLAAKLPNEERAPTIREIRQIAAIYYTIQEIDDTEISEPFKEVFEQAVLEAIAYRNPTLSFLFLRIFLREKENLDSFSALVSFGKQKAVCKYSFLPLAMLAKWLGKTEKKTTDEPAVKAIQTCLQKNRASFRDANTGIAQDWLLVCRVLDQNHTLSAQQKIDLLCSICKKLDSFHPLEDLKKRLSFINILCQLDRMPNELPSDDTTQFLSEFLSGIIQEDDYINLQEIDHFTEKYMTTLAEMRVPNAWKIYEMQIKKIKNPRLQEAFQKIIVSILEGKFKQLRYEEAERAPHISKIKEAHGDVWIKWKMGSPTTDRVASSFSFSTFLEKKWEEGLFIHSDGSAHFELLMEFLANPDQRELLSVKCRSEALKSKDPFLKIQSILMNLYLQEPSENEMTISLLTLEELLLSVSNFRFANDVKAIRTSLEKLELKGKSFTIVDTDEWQDLFLCGTEVLGSCQSVSRGDPMNICLIAYLIDGKNRMLAIKDRSTGRILARCMFRLLWNESKNQPILFQDQRYWSPSQFDAQQALNTMAKIRAKEMGLPLYTTEIRSDTIASSDKIVSFGSPAPFEYEDGSEGVMPKGEFTIRGPRLVLS